MAKTGKWDGLILAYALKNAVEHEGKCQEGAVIAGLFHEGLEKSQVRDVIKEIKVVVDKVNAMTPDEQQVEFNALKDSISHREGRAEGELHELENTVKGKVVMRIAPFPSGPLHIGNTRQVILNDEYAKKYEGKLYLVMDDTIGSEEKQIAPDAYKLIEQGVQWLKVKYQKPILYKSDRLEIYYKYAVELIEKGKAYVCYCDAETLRKNRAEGKECEHRSQTSEQALAEWKKMFKLKEGKAVLRIKTSMQDPNPAFRDRVLFRISEREHPRVKKKYRVWPLLEFSWAIDDKLLGMTHIIRGKELMMETDMEKFIFDIFGWKYPEFIHTGLLQFEGVKLSKSKGQKEIREGRYTGWDDPRTWSLQSLEKRGIQPEAIRKFIIGLGINQNEITVPIDILYAENRKLLNEFVKGYDFKQEAKGKLKILMPDGHFVTGSSSLKPKDKEIVYFKGFGFCKFDGKNKEFYFAHK
jgi:glutamyl-tRNA synthetase